MLIFKRESFMSRIMELGLLILMGLLSGCAAIQGAHGDAIVAKQTAAAQAASAQSSPGTEVDAETIAPPIQPRTAGQNASSEAAKIIAPLH
jgi:hypothetical protein